MNDLTRYPDVICHMTKTFDKVQNEHWNQYKKWGMQKRTLFEWLCYLTEEVGELSKAISENEYRDGTYKDIELEAIQVAALACKIVEVIQPSLMKAKEDKP